MKRAIPALLMSSVILGAGCGGAIPVHLSTSEAPGTITEPSDRVRDALDEGFGIWGLEYTLTGGSHSSRGILEVYLVELEPGALYTGYAAGVEHCRAELWAALDGPTLAHELGHVFVGPDHDEDPGSVMHATPGEWAAEGAQLVMDKNAWRFGGCR